MQTATRDSGWYFVKTKLGWKQCFYHNGWNLDNGIFVERAMKLEQAKDLIKILRNGEISRRLVTYCGNRVMQWIQLNKNEKFICWQRFYLPTNGDKSKAVSQNNYLSLKDVFNILSEPTIH